jgi:hypothetical protein
MNEKEIVPDESVVSKIYLIRNHKVMLDMDLAELYGVETKQLKRAVNRNLVRFPEDFMFELNMTEIEQMRCHSGTSTSRGGTRFTPMVFTEQGVAMLSSILNSERAVLVNIQIIRVFTRMREMLSTHKDILIKLKELEQQGVKNEQDIQKIFEYLHELENPKSESQPIGFEYNKSQ